VRIDHAAIWTRDLEALKEFYERYLGGRAAAVFADEAYDFRSYFLEFDEGPRLELMQMPSIPETRDDPLAQATGLVHLAFALDSEAAVDELAGRLAGDGHRVLDGPQRTADGYYEAAALDPEGNRFELIFYS
jgi:lactoylglutathione lyase